MMVVTEQQETFPAHVPVAGQNGLALSLDVSSSGHWRPGSWAGAGAWAAPGLGLELGPNYQQNQITEGDAESRDVNMFLGPLF